MCASWLFNLRVSVPLLSFFLLNLSSSLLLSLQFLSRAITLLNQCSIVVSWLSASINFLLMLPFMPLLNSLISKHSLYLLPLATLLKSCTNFSIVLSSCSILFNSATFIYSSSPPPNSFLISAKNSPIDSNSNSLASNSSNIFFFQISANPPWTCDNIH